MTLLSHAARRAPAAAGQGRGAVPGPHEAAPTPQVPVAPAAVPCACTALLRSCNCHVTAHVTAHQDSPNLLMLLLMGSPNSNMTMSAQSKWWSHSYSSSTVYCSILAANHCSAAIAGLKAAAASCARASPSPCQNAKSGNPHTASHQCCNMQNSPSGKAGSMWRGMPAQCCTTTAQFQGILKRSRGFWTPLACPHARLCS